MSDEKPNPFEDVRKGLGLLFRAAKTAAEKLPTKDLEEAVVTSAREVGRALENVGKTIEREMFGKREERRPREQDARTGDGEKHEKPREDQPPEGPKPPDAT